MVNKIRDLIARYISLNNNIESWEETRFMYSVYTYVAFLVISIKSLVESSNDIKTKAVDLKLESKENIEWLFEFPECEKLVEDIASMIVEEARIDIHVLYQDFIAIDYVVRNNRFSFSGGKNSRDTLGAYYTQEDFAYEITKKAIQEYISNCTEEPHEISIADFSCGGGAFLIAAKRICEEKKIQVNLFGIDVDPIAVMITKARLLNEQVDTQNLHVCLGNPLLKSDGNNKSSKAFIMALKGRYYNSSLGISISKRFDVVIGNPPWEKIRFEEKKFLAHYIQNDLIDTKKNRENIVLCESALNQKFYFSMITDYENAKSEIKKNDEFLYTRSGELNTYALFTEYALEHITSRGIVGIIVKSSLLKMPVYSEFMKHNLTSKKLFDIYMFVNRKKIFNIDSREEFSVVFYKNQSKEALKISVGIEEYKDFCGSHKLEISREILELLNPETSMIPNITNNDELAFLNYIYSNNFIFNEKYKDCHFGRLVHLTNHSQYILQQPKEKYLPIYEGKFIELYTGKFATFKDMSDEDKYKNKATARPIDNISGEEYPEARFYIEDKVWNNLSKKFNAGYIIAWRSLTSATNRRTMLATILPLVPSCQSIQLLQLNRNEDMIQVLALFNSIVFDYVVRLKMAGLDLTQTIVKQMPVPYDERYEYKLYYQERSDTLKNHITARLKYLYADDIRVKGIFDNSQSYEIRDKSRKQVISEIDVLVGLLYGLTKEEIKRIAKTFDKYYTKEEIEQWF